MSAQEKFAKYCNERRECRESVSAFTSAARKKFGDFGYAAGYLETLVADLMMEVPAKRRKEIMDQLNKKFADQCREYFVKEAA